jgi:hypothetical protein
MWEASEKAARMFTRADRAVQRYGEKIWDEVCATFSPDEPFTTRQAAALVQKRFGFTARTAEQYVRAVLQTAADDGPHCKRCGNFWSV